MKFVLKLRSSKRMVQRNGGGDSSAEANVTSESSRALHMRQYRAKLKENVEQYRLHCELERQRSYEYRKRMSADQKRRSNELAKLRMRRLREKKRNAAKKSPATEVIHTRSAEQKLKVQRDYWKEKKREERTKMSSQKKRRVREKDAQRKRVSRAMQKSNKSDSFATPAAKRKALSRAKSQMPRTSASKYAEVVKGLICTASQEQANELKKHGIVKRNCLQNDIFEVLRKTCHKLPPKKKAYLVSQMSRNLDAKHGLKSATSRQLGIRWKYLMKYTRLGRLNMNVERRKTRSDAISEFDKDAIIDHYRKPSISTVMPNKKLAGGGTPTYILQKSLQQTHKDFCAENTEVSVSFSKFANLRPKHVVLQNKAKLFQCLCEYCTNIELALKALNREAVSSKVKCTIRDKYHVSDITLCKDEYAEHASKKLPCIDRHCEKCGVNKLDAYLAPLVNKANEKELIWRQWGPSNEEGRKRVSLKRLNGTLHDLINHLKTLLAPFPCHLFQAKWQQTQFYTLSKHPPADTVVIVMDFAENFSCAMQNEVQSAHWHNVQVTLHPMVTYYQCPSDCGNSSPVRESIDVLSDDLQHDAHAVNHFVEVAVNHLKDVRGLSPKRLIQFSDGCAAQYKSKTPFMDLSCASTDFGIQRVERHYFGSRHGKNPCDGEGGVVKNCVAKAVRSEPDVVVDDSKSVFDFCVSRLTKDFDEEGKCNHSRRVFYHVEKGTINRERLDRSEVSTLPGTRQIHAAVGLFPYKLKTRRLSCFCSSCNSFTGCSNDEYTGAWTEKTLRSKSLPGKRCEQSNPVNADDDLRGSVPESEEFPGNDVDGSMDERGMALLMEMTSDQSDLPSQQVLHSSSQIKSVPYPCNPCINKYYAVFYDNEPYIGRVIEDVGHDADCCKFKFLHRVRTSTHRLYDWPSRDDVDNIPLKYIFHGPVNLIGNGPFQVVDFNTIDKLYKEIKQVSCLNEQ